MTITFMKASFMKLHGIAMHENEVFMHDFMHDFCAPEMLMGNWSVHKIFGKIFIFMHENFIFMHEDFISMHETFMPRFACIIRIRETRTDDKTCA